MKMRTRVKPVTGEELAAEPDTNVIRPGVTTRAEILRQFASFDTGWQGERLFLGRWLRSGFSANTGRLWHGRILVVEFDEKGVVIGYKVLSDKDFLAGENFWFLTSEKDQPSLQQPTRSEVCIQTLRPGNQQPACGTTIRSLNAGGKTFILLRGYPVHQSGLPSEYRIAADQVEELTPNTYDAVYDSAHREFRPPFTSDFVLYIHLKEKIYPEGDVGKKHGVKTIMLDTDVPTAALLIRFLRKPEAKQNQS